MDLELEDPEYSGDYVANTDDVNHGSDNDDGHARLSVTVGITLALCLIPIAVTALSVGFFKK